MKGLACWKNSHQCMTQRTPPWCLRTVYPRITSYNVCYTKLLRKDVTQISGRGVGLDVVSSEVKQLGGSLEIDSQPGRGTSFIIRLPLTLAITDALLLRIGEEVFAIPHGSVEGVVRIRRKDLLACYAGEQSGYQYAGKNYTVNYLGRMMGIGQSEVPETARWLPLLLLHTGEHQVALQVDELLGTRQVVVKSP